MGDDYAPPSVLDSADVLEYARIDESVFHDPNGPYLIANGERLWDVPGLVVARNNGPELDILLFCCDLDWNVLGAAGYPTVEKAKSQAEKQFIGVSKL